METILIARKNTDFAEALAIPLRAAGYRIITCPGPWPPVMRCIRCTTGSCPLTEAADLLIYDPDLIGYDASGQPQLLALESALAHPDVPLLLAWPTGEPEPAGLASLLRDWPNLQLARSEGRELVEQVGDLLNSPSAARRELRLLFEKLTRIYAAAHDSGVEPVEREDGPEGKGCDALGGH